MRWDQKVQIEVIEFICSVKWIDGVVAQKTLESELIRCKDCIYHECGTQCKQNKGTWFDKDYCSKAEREKI